MKGLLWKDILGLKKYMKSIAFVLVLYVVLALVLKSTVYISSMMAILFMMLPLTVFAYDESAKWDAFGLTLPVTRKQVVLSRYLLVLLIFAAGFLFSLLMGGLLSFMPNMEGSFQECAAAALAVSCLGLVVQSVMLPMTYRFGAEKGRFVMIGVFLLIFLSMFLFNQLIHIPTPSEQMFMAILFAAPVAALALLAVSYGIAVSIYSKKEI